MKSQHKNHTALTHNQKESIAILSMGTFLEYFDLMLYVHLAVVLNEVFFPKTDPFTGSLITALAFCSTYILRPLGAIIFGYLGDYVGRKTTVITTTIAMSISCLVMANLPTYAQIGITASWLVTICRIVQGLCTMGEVNGANIYLTEITKPPVQYVAVGTIAIVGALGGVCALGVGSLVINQLFNWRIAFWIGSIIALVGAYARTRLREAKDYADAKRRVLGTLKDLNQKSSFLKQNIIWNEKVKKATALALFSVECTWPVCFYFAYMHCGHVLKNSLHFTSEEVIQQNFILSMIQLASWIIVIALSYKIYPLKILRVKLVIFITLLPFCIYLLDNVTSSYQVLLVQSFVVSMGFMGVPAMPIFYRQLPIFKRFTYITFMYALSRAVIYVITSFGLTILAKYLGNWSFVVIILPIAFFFNQAINYFDKLNKVAT
ncbi:MAG: MFS transporter [Rickettsiaceae bacterium]